jgi:SAM-dependent methyltransferase
MSVDPTSRSYDMGALDSDSELPRLERQAQVALDIELEALRALNLPPDATIADVGCGPGFMSCQLARLVPEGRVIGIDADPELLASARASAAQQGLTHVETLEAWAHEIDLPDDCVDFSYGRFLLQHVPDPVAIAREMRRITRPGGLVMLLDTDDGGLIVYPPPEGLDILLAASQRSQAAMGGDRHIGRKLREVCVEAGLEQIDLRLVPFTSDMVGMHVFVDIALGYKRQIIDPSDMGSAQIQDVIDRLLLLAKDPRAFAHTMAYVATARSPRS